MSQPSDTQHPDCPYPGLRPFRKDEDLLFFGRNQQIDEILLRLKTHQFLGFLHSNPDSWASWDPHGMWWT
jgi:hypothetical protein